MRFVVNMTQKIGIDSAGVDLLDGAYETREKVRGSTANFGVLVTHATLVEKSYQCLGYKLRLDQKEFLIAHDQLEETQDYNRMGIVADLARYQRFHHRLESGSFSLQDIVREMLPFVVWF